MIFSKGGLLYLILAVFMIGCSESELADSKGGDKWLKSYLKKEPVVRSIEDLGGTYGPGLLIKTDHYDIYTTVQDVLMLRQIPVFLENVQSEYRKISGVDSVSKNRNKIYIFETREQWESFGEYFTAELWPVYKRIEKGAYYVKGACVAYNIGRTDTFAIIAHEGWHQFSHRYFKYRIPAWLDEGIAMQFEGFKKYKGRYVFSSSYNYMRMQGLKRAYEQGYKPSLVELLTENPAVVISGQQDDVALRVNAYYSKVYALVRFLREYNGGIYRPRLEKMIQSLQEGSWKVDDDLASLLEDRNNRLTTKINHEVGIQLFTDYYGKKLDTIEEQFDMYCYCLVLKQLEK